MDPRPTVEATNANALSEPRRVETRYLIAGINSKLLCVSRVQFDVSDFAVRD
jgi:hypothetical protein